MKNIQWVLVIGMVVVACVFFVGIYASLYFYLQAQGQGHWPDLESGLFMLFYVIPGIFILTPTVVALLAKERKVFHALLTVLCMLLVAVILLYIRYSSAF